MGNTKLDTSVQIEWTERTPHMVGRQHELDRLHTCLHARAERHFIYYWGEGGLGKTRLLQELQHMVKEAGPGFHSCGIIDLYHTDTHSTSDIERAIVEGLDPERHYFTKYREERRRYERLRERGTDPGVLEKRREALSQTFVNECKDMALDERKLVICFDTIELLQYESSMVEQMAGLHSVDTRIRPWLLEKLPELRNVLIVFAGRPKPTSLGQTVDHQKRLEEDMRAAFRQDLKIVPLPPFTSDETQLFINTLAHGTEIIPSRHLPVVHRLTNGRPIYLHLIVDLLQQLSPEPATVLAMFEQYADLADAPEDDDRLKQARNYIEVEIVRSIFQCAGEMGGYLEQIALLPKGVNPEILQEGLGLSQADAQQLYKRLEPLSFIKHPKPAPGSPRLHEDRLFLHDEMYQLLKLPDIIPHLRIKERQVTHTLIRNYYDPHIQALHAQIAAEPSPDRRVPLREQLQKLQAERLYYLLANNPCLGYREYPQLSDQANRQRWVGFGMRLLDEFLRFYNDEARRAQCLHEGITHEQVIRESAQMWVERFYWWGQLDRLMEFAGRVLQDPEALQIHSDNIDILGNIAARWTDTLAMRKGYDPDVVSKAQSILDSLPAQDKRTPEQTLAYARLSTAIGYQYRLGGLLQVAVEHYKSANVAFRKLQTYRDELAILLNNLSFVYARQGRMERALPLANEALQINQALGNTYSAGLTLSTLAAIERIRGRYSKAVEYGEEALSIFRELEDPHGTALAYLSIASAKRKMVKGDIERDRKPDEARHKLDDAQRSLSNALEIAEAAGLKADMPPLYAELGKVYRELGHLVHRGQGLEKAAPYYRDSEKNLRAALTNEALGKVDRADIHQDLAETLFLNHAYDEANQQLMHIKDLIGPEYEELFEKQTNDQNLPNEYFWPLGKAEKLRGTMDFTAGNLDVALQHYATAYIYFMHFSPDAIEKEGLVDSLYNHMITLLPDRRIELVQSARDWTKQQYSRHNGEAFIEILEDLIGI